MPPLPSVPNVIKTIIKGTKAGKSWANILHYAYTGTPPSVTDVTNVAADLVTAWNAFMKPRATVDAQLEGVEVVDLSSAFGAKIDHVITPIVGTNGEDPLPNNVSFLVDYPVTMLYRGGHPRTYILPGGDGDLDAAGLTWNFWNGSFIAAMATSWAGFSSAITAHSYGSMTVGDQCAVRYKSGGAPLLVPIVLPLTTFDTEANIASQRRRSRVSS